LFGHFFSQFRDGSNWPIHWQDPIIPATNIMLPNPVKGIGWRRRLEFPIHIDSFTGSAATSDSDIQK
jgi:hypothetical protein